MKQSLNEMVFYTRRAKVTTWYTAPTAIRRLMRMEDIKPKIQSENLRSILSVGEPLNAEAVIWGEENFGFYYGQLVATEGRYYDSQLSFNESKTGSMGKPLPGVEMPLRGQR
jgi:acetyl-CoA synthetase